MLVEATDDHFAALITGAAPLGLQVPDGGVEAVEVLQMLQGLAQSVRQEISPASWLIVADVAKSWVSARSPGPSQRLEL